MEKNKKILIFAAIIIYILANAGYYVRVKGTEEVVLIFNTVGYLEDVIAICFILYGLYTNKKSLYYVGVVGSILCYFIPFMAVSGEFTGLEFGLGFYMYTVATIMFGASLFLNGKHATLEEVIPESIEGGFDKNISYLIGKYIYGYKELEGFKQCVLQDDKDNKILNLLISNDENGTKKELKYSDIKEITYKTQTIVGNTEHKVEDNTTANAVLATMLVGPGVGGFLFANALNSVKDYDKLSVSSLFEIRIKLEENTILIQTKVDPSDFVDKININM